MTVEDESFAKWLKALEPELARQLGMTEAEAAVLIQSTGPGDCWREMFDDGLSPEDAAGEEAHAAAWMGALTESEGA